MRSFTRLIATATLGLFFMGVAAADTLELKDGSVVQGRFLGGTQALVRFSVNGQVQTYNVTEIVALTFTNNYGNAAPPPRIRHPRLSLRLMPQRRIRHRRRWLPAERLPFRRGKPCWCA